MQRTAILLLLLLAAPLPASAQTAYSVQSDGDDKLYSIDLATGAATAIGPSGFQDIESLTFSPHCGTLFGVDDVVDALVTCNIQTGACTEVGRLGVDITDTGLAVASSGQYYISTDVPVPENLYRADFWTGAATRVELSGSTSPAWLPGPRPAPLRRGAAPASSGCKATPRAGPPRSSSVSARWTERRRRSARSA